MRITEERLPWLADDPAPAPAAPSRRVRGTTRAMWPWYLLLLLLVAAVAASAWWLGTRQHDAQAPELSVEQPLAIPVTRIEEPTNETMAAEPLPEPVAELLAEAPSAAIRSAPARPEPAPAPMDGSEIEAEVEPDPGPETEGPVSARSVFPAEEAVVTPLPATGPAPVVASHPQKYRGRVVQLGAFPSRAQAEATWQRVTRRYPYLATKPKMVNTVDVRALGGGRGTRMYRLQLGTSSQAQSAVICQQLERVGQSCVVVY